MSRFTYLKEYDTPSQELYDMLVERSINSLPYTLALPVSCIYNEIEKGDYFRAMNHMLVFFEISAQYLSTVLLQMVRNSPTEAAHNVAVNFVDKVDSKRPLSFGDWTNELLTPLMNITEKENGDSMLIQAICKSIYVKHVNKLTDSKKEMSIVRIRNEFRAHAAVFSDEIYKKVLIQLEPRFLAMLQALEPLTYANFVAIGASGEKWLMNGTEPMIAEDIELPSPQKGHYYIKSRVDGAVTDLYPLVLMNKDNFVYVFQTLKENSVAYMSSNENAITITTEEYNEDFDRNFQSISPNFDIARTPNWNEMKQMMRYESSLFLDRVYKEKKYNRELFVERDSLTAMLDAFIESEATIFPLIGEAGQGKTNQLCYWTETLTKKEFPVLIFNSTEFSDISFPDKMKMIFHCKQQKQLLAILRHLHSSAETNGCYVYFFFDAINECLKYHGSDNNEEAPLQLYNDIAQLLVSPEFPRFKTLFTCRVYTWKNLIQPMTAKQGRLLHRVEEESGVTVAGFNKEESEKAYRMYQELYQMRTPFAEIDPRVALRLRDPLVLKITGSNYLGKALSADTNDYTSLRLFEHLTQEIGNSYAGRMQCEIIDCIAEYMLSCYLKGEPCDSISVTRIKAAHESDDPLLPLKTALFNEDGITIAYAELLNKTERPILKEVERGVLGKKEKHIQFVYERFLEFILGRALFGQMRSRLLFGHTIPATAYADALKSCKHNTVLHGAVRNALLLDCLDTGCYDIFIELETEYDDNDTIKSIVTDAIDTLIKENYENELFGLMNRMLDVQPEGGTGLIEEFNGVIKLIESNKADSNVIAKHKELHAQLESTIRLRNLASVSIINGILLSEYFNESLYMGDVKELLWRVMTDPLLETRNDACKCAYYLSKKRYTLGHTPLQKNLAEYIVKEMYAYIKAHTLVMNAIDKKLRSRMIIFIETATRLAVMLIIDNLLDEKNGDGKVVDSLFEEIRDIFRYATFRFRLIRIIMPFLQLLMRKQITFQSDYVNNAIEYQTFWEEDTFANELWKPESVNEAISFLNHYNQLVLGGKESERANEEERYRRFHPQVLSAYRLGDSFSYFILERIQVIMGVSRWENISPVVEEFFSDRYRNNEWFDYSQMSMLYVLYQVAVHSKEFNSRLLEIYTRESEDWSNRTRGLFKGRRSAVANPTGLYKRNVMNWYAVVYCKHHGDNIPHSGDTVAVPLIYRMIDRAVEENDKELLFHLIENISELITDHGYIDTSLDLIKYILVKFDTQEKVDRIDSVHVERNGIYRYSLERLIGNVFSTAKNYFPGKVDTFIKKDIVGLSFPGIPSYREEILNYNPSGETLSDLLTHKFGNFLMWALLNKDVVDNFAEESVKESANSKNSFIWYEKVVRILVKHMFGIRL